MPVRLQTLRLYITTKDVERARTDDKVFLQIDLSGKAVPLVRLNNPGNDRERGKTDFYEVSLIDGVKLSDANGEEVSVSSSGSITSASVPPGVEFESWEALRQLPIFLVTTGANAWRFFKYHLLGEVVYLDPVSNPIDAPYSILFHDWLLLSSRDGDVVLSTQDDDGGDPRHQLVINGVFPQVP